MIASAVVWLSIIYPKTFPRSKRCSVIGLWLIAMCTDRAWWERLEVVSWRSLFRAARKVPVTGRPGTAQPGLRIEGPVGVAGSKGSNPYLTESFIEAASG